MIQRQVELMSKWLVIRPGIIDIQIIIYMCINVITMLHVQCIKFYDHDILKIDGISRHC
jgi:hypothetical protein